MLAAAGAYLLYRFVKSVFGSDNNNMNIKAGTYVCPMHADVVSDEPGRSKCGEMELVPRGADKAHEHGSMADHMSGEGTAGDFLRRFWTVTVLLAPLLLLTQRALGIFGITDFGLRPYIQFGLASAIFYFSLVFFQHAKHEVKARQYGMMTLVSLAVGAGYAFSAASTFLPFLDAEFYLEISTLIWVLLFGHYLEARSSMAAGDALGEVAKLLPKKAHLFEGGKQHDVDVDSLKKGDVVVVKPGEKVPADGVIASGAANFNEALISGESKPIEKAVGQQVVAGSICIDSAVRVELTRVGEHSTIGQIQTLIAAAKQTKPTAQSIADRASRILTFTALTVALTAIVVWSFVIGETLVFALTLGITVLVIACPHALGLAIPTVSTIATTLAVKNGLFIKNMAKLEVARAVDYVVFDKTGTLTKGEFGVSEVVAAGGKEREILALAASLESQSSHMLGISMVNFAKDKKIALKSVSKFKNIAGKGVSGEIAGTIYTLGKPELLNKNLWTRDLEGNYQRLVGKGKTVVVLATRSEVLGMVVLSDEVKRESKMAVREFHRLGIKTAILTGDNETVARAVAEELNIDDFFANVLPENKYKHIQKLQDTGNTVMMVGDGVNDAPALTQADVGVAIGAGTDVAVEAGDVVLVRSNPLDVVSLVVLARKVYRKILENLLWALGYNVVAIPAAAGLFIPLGFRLRPEVGALLMSLSSVIVVLNALTLRRVRLK